MTPQPADLIIRTGAALPMTDDAVVYDAMIAVKDGRITFVGDATEGSALYRSDAVVGGPDSVALPGLINAHTHVGIHFFGTLCDEGNVINALYDLLFPMEVGFDEEMMQAAAALGLWDAARSGVTTVCDHFHFPDATARAMHRIGLRGLVADKIIEFTLDDPPRYDARSQTYEINYQRGEAEHRLAHNLEFIERWRGDALVRPCLGPHAPDTLSTEMLQEIAAAATGLDVKMLMHVAQSAAEVEQVRRKGYPGSIHYLADIGFLSPRLQAAHMVYVDDDEIRIAGDSGMNMSFNPVIMLACHSFPKVDKLHAAGVGMGMGTDCLQMDQLEEMRYGIYLANYLRGEDGFRLRAYDLLRMATCDGARCLGMGDEIGTLEVGKRADVVVLDLRDGQLVPNTNYFETVAFYAKSRNVSHTIVDGRVVYADGQLQLANQDEIYRDGKRLALEWLRRDHKIIERTGLLPRFQAHVFEAWSRLDAGTPDTAFAGGSGRHG
jgi:5-methylthioadenosine/S-adenosylhomocysteine deaminase